jgi:hypothetical protein
VAKISLKIIIKLINFIISGKYTCEYTKEEGICKIKKLKWHLIYLVPPAQDWVIAERIAVIVMQQPRKSTKPDKPKEFDTRYPSGNIVPFHYKHPVTDEELRASTK